MAPPPALSPKQQSEMLLWGSGSVRLCTRDGHAVNWVLPGGPGGATTEVALQTCPTCMRDSCQQPEWQC